MNNLSRISSFFYNKNLIYELFILRDFVTQMLTDYSLNETHENKITETFCIFPEGGSANPEKNPKLAYLLEQAKKKQIPNGTVKAFLEKMQSSKESCHNVWINISGPNKSLIVVHLVTDNTERSRHNINTMLRKHMFVLNNFENSHLYSKVKFHV